MEDIESSRRAAHLELREIEKCLEVGDVVQPEVVVGDDDGPAVGDLLRGVGHQDPAGGGVQVGLTVVVTLAEAPLDGLLHCQGPQLTVVLHQPLWHCVSARVWNCANHFNSFKTERNNQTGHCVAIL